MTDLNYEFKTSETESFSGTSQKTNKPYSITKQEAWIHGIDVYPTKTNVMLKDNQKPYAPGMYRVDIPFSLYVDRNGRLAISPVLIAVASTQKTP